MVKQLNKRKTKTSMSLFVVRSIIRWVNNHLLTDNFWVWFDDSATAIYRQGEGNNDEILWYVVCDLHNPLKSSAKIDSLLAPVWNQHHTQLMKRLRNHNRVQQTERTRFIPWKRRERYIFLAIKLNFTTMSSCLLSSCSLKRAHDEVFDFTERIFPG